MFHRIKLVAQLTRGLILADPKRSFFGRVWQLLSRFTWELPHYAIAWNEAGYLTENMA